MPSSKYEWAKGIVDFSSDDAKNLMSLRPIVEEYAPKVTDAFYDMLLSRPETAQKIDGRVDALKTTHKAYLLQLVGGEYGQQYFNSRLIIGKVHVVQGIEPHWVESIMSVIRSAVVSAMCLAIEDREELAAKTASWIKICDLDLLVINFAYAEERLDRLSKFTGMSRVLIENVINAPPRK